MPDEPVRCEVCDEVVHAPVIAHHPDDGAVVLCEVCAAQWFDDG